MVFGVLDPSSSSIMFPNIDLFVGKTRVFEGTLYILP